MLCPKCMKEITGPVTTVDGLQFHWDCAPDSQQANDTLVNELVRRYASYRNINVRQCLDDLFDEHGISAQAVIDSSFVVFTDEGCEDYWRITLHDDLESVERQLATLDPLDYGDHDEVVGRVVVFDDHGINLRVFMKICVEREDSSTNDTDDKSVLGEFDQD